MATIIVFLICVFIIIGFFQYFTGKRLDYLYRTWGLYRLDENVKFIKKNMQLFLSMVFVPFFIPLLLSLFVFIVNLFFNIEYGGNTSFIDKIYFYHFIFTLIIIGWGFYELGRNRLKDTTSFTYDEAAQFSAFKIIAIPTIIIVLVIISSVLFKLNLFSTLEIVYNIIFYICCILILSSVIFFVSIFIYFRSQSNISTNIFKK